MKYILLCLFIPFILSAKYRGLSANDYMACEKGIIPTAVSTDNPYLKFKADKKNEDYKYYNPPSSGDDCNARWQPEMVFDDQNEKITAYPDFRCCYVRYKMREDEVEGCYLMQDTKKERSHYKDRVLAHFEGVKIKCAGSYIKTGILILVIALLL